jgi:hypothetical protein
MQEIRSTSQEAAEDIFFGQVVINWARWFIIGGGVILVLWTSGEDTGRLVLGIIPVVALMVMNFYLHGRRLAQRPANPPLITLSSLIDVALITVVVLVWTGGTGLDSPFFIMYYPVVLAFAFVMPPRITITYTLVVLVAYAGACFLAEIVGGGERALLSSDFDVAMGALESLVTRLITLGAMGALGTYYWRIQRDRRRRAAGATGQAKAQQVGS